MRCEGSHGAGLVGFRDGNVGDHDTNRGLLGRDWWVEMSRLRALRGFGSCDVMWRTDQSWSGFGIARRPFDELDARCPGVMRFQTVFHLGSPCRCRA